MAAIFTKNGAQILLLLFELALGFYSNFRVPPPVMSKWEMRGEVACLPFMEIVLNSVRPPDACGAVMTKLFPPSGVIVILSKRGDESSYHSVAGHIG